MTGNFENISGPTIGTMANHQGPLLRRYFITAPPLGYMQDNHKTTPTITVNFTKMGSAGSVMLYYSLDGGQSFTYIATVAHPTLTYAWTPPVQSDETKTYFDVILEVRDAQIPTIKQRMWIRIYNQTIWRCDSCDATITPINAVMWTENTATTDSCLYVGYTDAVMWTENTATTDSTSNSNA